MQVHVITGTETIKVFRSVQAKADAYGGVAEDIQAK
jgi:hypothetical protein